MATDDVPHGPVTLQPPYALDRDQGEHLTFGDTVIVLRTTAESTGGALTIWEEIPLPVGPRSCIRGKQRRAH